jgi:hypothetical protein
VNSLPANEIIFNPGVTFCTQALIFGTRFEIFYPGLNLLLLFICIMLRGISLKASVADVYFAI